jgi:hypothetical protein
MKELDRITNPNLEPARSPQYFPARVKTIRNEIIIVLCRLTYEVT